MSCSPPRLLRPDIRSIKAPFKHLGCLRFLSSVRPVPLKLRDLFQIPDFEETGFLPPLLSGAGGIAAARARAMRRRLSAMVLSTGSPEADFRRYFMSQISCDRAVSLLICQPS